MRDTAGKLDHLDATLNVAFGVGNRLAVLAREHFSETVCLLRDQFEEFEEHAGAALRIGSGPGRLRRLGILDGAAKLGFRGECDLRNDVAGHRLKNVAGTARRTFDVFAADEVPDLAHDEPPENAAFAAACGRF